MRYFKFPDQKTIHPVADDNVVIHYQRSGFIEVNKKGEPLIKEEATETDEEVTE